MYFIRNQLYFQIGSCDQAIVGSAAIFLSPLVNCKSQWNGTNAPDGIPKVFDENADGYVRGEAVVGLLLQRKSNAKRIYATVLSTGVNMDGYKSEGIETPSSQSQQNLMEEVASKALINPANIEYVEAHATGTNVSLIVETSDRQLHAFKVEQESVFRVNRSVNQS